MPNPSVLIVDDQPDKLEKIRKCIEAGGIPSSSIDVASNSRDTKILLNSKKYDLLVLDIALPEREGDKVDPYAGLRLLREVIERVDGFFLPANVIGLTQHEDLYVQAQEEFSALYWTLDKYSEGEVGWQNRLTATAHYLADQYSHTTKSGFGCDIVIVAALEKELDAVRRLPWNWSSPESLDSAVYQYRGNFHCIDQRAATVVAACAPRPGMVTASILAMKMIVAHRPRILVMTGITAGVEKACEIGDLLLADPSWDWQSGKHESGTFLQAPDQISVSIDIRQRFFQLSKEKAKIFAIYDRFIGTKPSTVPQIRIGPVASGSSVLADAERIEHIKGQNRKAIGVEMEIYGVYSAARDVGQPRPLFFGIKSVCDFGKTGKDDKFHEYCSYMSANIIHLFFETYLPDLTQN